jgi:hypothetical protein
MRKAKKTKVPQRRTELDQIVTQLHTILRRDTTSIIEKGKLLLRSRKLLADEHGEWQSWLVENFDLSLRTAQNYCAAAEYVARAKSKSATVADFSNLSPSVLYWLAAGHYNEQEEAAILAAARKKRVDHDAALAICEALAPPDNDDADDGDDQDQDDGDQDDGDDGAAEDPEIAAILDGPPPTPPAGSTENLTPTNFALRAFDQAIGALKQLMTKPSAQFAGTIHGVNDLETIADFIRAVAKSHRQAGAMSDAPEAMAMTLTDMALTVIIPATVALALGVDAWVAIAWLRRR